MTALAKLDAMKRIAAFVAVREKMAGTDPEVITESNGVSLLMSDLRAALSARASAGEGGEWVDGVKACIAWVEKRRHDFEREYGMIDPSTGAMEFRSVAKEEYDCELGEIEEGLRSLLTAAPRPQAPVLVFDNITPSVRDDGALVLTPAHGDGEVVLPELPFPDTFTSDSFNGMKLYFTAEQMREYARQVLTTRPTPEAQEARDSEFPEPSAESLAKARIEALTRTAFDSKMAKAAWIIDRARAIDAALALPAQGEGKNG